MLPPRAARDLLLPVLRNLDHAAGLTLSQWDVLLPVARQARLLGQLSSRLMARQDLFDAMPEPVKGHLVSARNFARSRRQRMLHELEQIIRVLPETVDVVLLKGVAYAVAGEAFADGRLSNDIDLLVPRAQLELVERALGHAGWLSTAANPYDQRYYREWSHELPPMRHPRASFELDLHFTLSPVIGRVTPDEASLFERASAVHFAGRSVRLLSMADRIVHTAVHLFQDSELSDGLRDLVDLDGMLRQQWLSMEFSRGLEEAAVRHHAMRATWHGLAQAHRLLGTPFPDELAAHAPGKWTTSLMNWVVDRALIPKLPICERNLGIRVAGRLGQLRYHWLRMPPGLLLRHLAHKSWHSLFVSRAASPR